jgi:hypothetical protein
MITFIVILAVCLVAGFIGIPAVNRLLKPRSEIQARQAHWKQFDDTHHWDASADEWVRNDGQRKD